MSRPFRRPPGPPEGAPGGRPEPTVGWTPAAPLETLPPELVPRAVPDLPDPTVPAVPRAPEGAAGLPIVAG
jgi:hypothetical protein